MTHPIEAAEAAHTATDVARDYAAGLARVVQAAEAVKLPDYVYGRETHENEKLIPLGDVETYRANVLAALRAALPALREVPAGWKLVPVEADLRMVVAGGVALTDASEHDLEATVSELKACYAAMLAAAPPAPAPDLATPSGGQEAGPEEDRIEAAYWRFDARHKGYGEWKRRP